MRSVERGFMLLCCQLGDSERRCLSASQFQTLSRRAALEQDPFEDGEVTEALLTRWGYPPEMARRIVGLLAQELALDRYLRRAEALGITSCTRISYGYPRRLIQALRQSAPPVLALWGEESLLGTRCIAVVGSREPDEKGAAFASEAGRRIAEQGYTLVSGNARGCDRIAQQSCLRAGGRVVSVVADDLSARCRGEKPKDILYCSEMGYDLPFSPQRALSRNRIIHALGEKVLAIQPRPNVGGTWAGAAENLKKRWSPVFVAADGGTGTLALAELGAVPVEMEALANLDALRPAQVSLF